MNKKIITIAEIVFALIFVVLLAVFMATINSKGNSANNQLVNTLEATDSSNVQAYGNGTIVKGSRVKGAIDQVKSLNGDVKMQIKVVTGSGEDETTKIYSENKGYTQTDTRAEDYINTTADFYCYHNVNSNGVTIGLAFVQSDVTDADEIDDWASATNGTKWPE